ncbi:MAG: DUF2299 family protein [Candidatus Thermoplasmatota archaeon]|nr:DUF2299 family protein [Candidatus Thermoplasmatota archaeon]MEC8540403.1 DUF2299 family protein [Candidatus Thermoplasmatota archaeon]
MTPSEAVSLVRKWLDEERLFVKQQNDPRAHAHFLIKYPQGKQGHMFAVVVPKNRDLVAISSMTRVDEGQQNEMTNHMSEDKDGWSEWIHEARLQLINSAVDWGIHMGHKNNKKPGPLQAFNVSLPIWLDGLTKNEFMHSLRRLWLAKLGIIHEIKYSYGPGIGKPGPVDDWEKNKSTRTQTSQTKPVEQESLEVEFDEKMSFGTSFDPSEWA